MGPLLALACAPERFRNKQAIAYVDNVGSVIWWGKGWARSCELGNTVIRALYLLTKALNCELELEHIHRCSNREARAVDAISKSDWNAMRLDMWQVDRFPRRTPATLVAWMNDPKPTRSLGENIISEMARTNTMLGHQRKRKRRWDN